MTIAIQQGTITIETLQGLSTLVLALSAANERVIEAIKNLLTPFLKKNLTKEGDIADPVMDRWRQLAVQLMSLLTAVCTAAWVAGGSPIAWSSVLIVPASGGSAPVKFSVVLLGLLTCGGSAFWNSVLDYARAAAAIRSKAA